MSTNLKEWQKGVKDGIPIALGYMAVSFTFGIIAKQSGFNPFEALFMSITNFTSAGQFAGLTLIATSAAFLEIALTQLIINSRYFLMSAALSQKIDQRTPLIHRMIMAAGISDEVFGLSMTVQGEVKSLLYIWNHQYGDAWMGIRYTFRGGFRKYFTTEDGKCIKYCTIWNVIGCHYSSC